MYTRNPSNAIADVSNPETMMDMVNDDAAETTDEAAVDALEYEGEAEVIEFPTRRRRRSKRFGVVHGVPRGAGHAGSGPGRESRSASTSGHVRRSGGGDEAASARRFSMLDKPERSGRATRSVTVRDDGTFERPAVEAEQPAADALLEREITLGIAASTKDVARNGRAQLGQFAARFMPDKVEIGGKDGPLYVTGALKADGPRNNENMSSIELIAFDLDDGADLDKLCSAVERSGFAGIVHTTYSSTPEVPRARVILFLAEAVPADPVALKRVRRALWMQLGDGVKDDASLDKLSQPIYFPRVPNAAAKRDYFFKWFDGAAVDFDEVLKDAPEVEAQRATTGHGGHDHEGLTRVRIPADTQHLPRFDEFRRLADVKGFRWAKFLAKHGTDAREKDDGTVEAYCLNQPHMSASETAHTEEDAPGKLTLFARDADPRSTDPVLRHGVITCNHAKCGGGSASWDHVARSVYGLVIGASADDMTKGRPFTTFDLIEFCVDPDGVRAAFGWRAFEVRAAIDALPKKPSAADVRPVAAMVAGVADPLERHELTTLLYAAAGATNAAGRGAIDETIKAAAEVKAAAVREAQRVRVAKATLPEGSVHPAILGQMDLASPFDEGERGIAKTFENFRRALHRLGIGLRHNLFTDRVEVAGVPREPFLTDACLLRIVHSIESKFGLIVAKDNARHYLNDVAHLSAYHPVKEYLDGLTWDGVKRLDAMLTTYAGAEDVPLNAAFGSTWMVAAVARIYRPGVKFDSMLVLEGKQNTGKSSFLRVLASPPWFTDNASLGADPKLVIEATSGKWIVEVPEMVGGRKSEVEKIKAQISRQVDKARAAYGWFVEEVPRQFVYGGTTNDAKYLRDQTGNRRFWPVACSGTDFAALIRDRDQLWSEAVARYREHYADAAVIELPKEYREAAQAAQAERMDPNAYEDALQVKLAALPEACCVRSHDVYEALGIPVERRHVQMKADVAAAMAALGFESKLIRFKDTGEPARGYKRGDGKLSVYVWQRNQFGSDGWKPSQEGETADAKGLAAFGKPEPA
ncbi:MAG: hypothetical protein JNM89_02170 [Hyphomicrobiaceae bacterium]|nr:hypothetical protein [Hyphomicrobiaceae bacterium]